MISHFETQERDLYGRRKCFNYIRNAKENFVITWGRSLNEFLRIFVEECVRLVIIWLFCIKYVSIVLITRSQQENYKFSIAVM